MGNKFGGEWTEEKLVVVSKYINFYCEALKNQNFKKIYIDCFAGSGDITMKDGRIIDGSAKIALDNNPSFDEYILIETNKENLNLLEKLKLQYPDKKITIYNNDLIGDITEV